MQLVLGKICDFINGGAWSDDEYVDSGIHVVKVTNMEDSTIVAQDDNYLPLTKYERYRQHELRSDDIVVATVGSHPTQPGSVVGRTARIPKAYAGSFLNQNAVCLRTNRSDIVNQRYLFYLSKTVLFKHHIESRARGSANQVRMALGELKKFSTDYPSIDDQRKIAAILSAYDELIENNKQRIGLLEKLAAEIYREWFVRLRFPGHEKVKRSKGVPNGWEVAELKTVAIEAGQSTRPGNHLAERFYLPLDLLNTKQVIPGGHQRYAEAQSSLVTFEKGDFLFGAMRPYLHKVAIAPFAGITRTTCFVVRPKMPPAWSWLFLTLFQRSTVDFATMICNGSDRPYAVWNKGMERMKLLRPDDTLLAKFEEAVHPILDSIVSMYFVQLKLTSCRDLLLPRLISGKLSVENLDIQFPPGMAEELNAEAPATVHA
jgi:type I restriction enzyme S subunit